MKPELCTNARREVHVEREAAVATYINFEVHIPRPIRLVSNSIEWVIWTQDVNSIFGNEGPVGLIDIANFGHIVSNAITAYLFVASGSQRLESGSSALTRHGPPHLNATNVPSLVPQPCEVHTTSWHLYLQKDTRSRITHSKDDQ